MAGSHCLFNRLWELFSSTSAVIVLPKQWRIRVHECPSALCASGSETTIAAYQWTVSSVFRTNIRALRTQPWCTGMEHFQCWEKHFYIWHAQCDTCVICIHCAPCDCVVSKTNAGARCIKLWSKISALLSRWAWYMNICMLRETGLQPVHYCLSNAQYACNSFADLLLRTSGVYWWNVVYARRVPCLPTLRMSRFKVNCSHIVCTRIRHTGHVLQTPSSAYCTAGARSSRVLYCTCVPRAPAVPFFMSFRKQICCAQRVQHTWQFAHVRPLKAFHANTILKCARTAYTKISELMVQCTYSVHYPSIVLLWVHILCAL